MTITLDGSAGITTNTGAVYNGLQSTTAVASTSGTSIDFTGIPLWVKRVTVMLNGVSLSGTAQILIQLGSGSIDATGYVSTATVLASGGSSALITSTAGFIVYSSTATDTVSGNMVINTLGSNIWTSSHSMARAVGNGSLCGGGTKTLSGTLDRIRITTSNGTDTFDAGTINLIYE